MTTYTTVFGEQLGGSDEDIQVKIEYCQDFTGDGYDDIRITLDLTNSNPPNSGTEDIIGVAFDLSSVLAGISITDIGRSTYFGTLSTFTPTTGIAYDDVSDNPGDTDPGFNTSAGGSDEPYDAFVKVSDQGSGEGIVQKFSFVLTKASTDLDAHALLNGTDWWVRLQSTNGGTESAKEAGYILTLPPCDDGGGAAVIQIVKDMVCDGDDDEVLSDGATLLAGSPITWRYTVTNPGDVAISNVTVTDDNGTPLDENDDFEADYVGGDDNDNGDLDPGEAWIFQYTGAVVRGGYGNTAEAAGTYDDAGEPTNISDTDDASYVGVLVAEDSIVLVKEVSVDGGDNWLDANEETGPTLLAGYDDPRYRFTITNNSDVELTINLADLGLGIDHNVVVAAGGFAVVDEIDDAPITAAWAAGQQLNTAAISATFTDDCGNTANPSGSDVAYYFGADPSLTIDKQLWCVDDGVFAEQLTGENPILLAGSAIGWKYQVSNTGNVALSNVQVVDDMGTEDTNDDVTFTYAQLISGDADGDEELDTDETWVFQQTGTALRLVDEDDNLASYTNTATATATFADDAGNEANSENTEGLSSTDTSTYAGVVADIDVEKYVWDPNAIGGAGEWVDVDSAIGVILMEGTNPQFKFVVSNTGDVDLSDVVLTDSVFDLNGQAGDDSTDAGYQIGTLAAGGPDFELIYTGATWTVGQHSNTATAAGSFTDDCGNTANPDDSDSAYYYGWVKSDAHTPGFWKNHFEAWNNANDGRKEWTNIVGSDLAAVDILPNNLSGILLGDANGNGLTDSGECTLLVGLQAARQLIDSSDSANDTRQILLKHALAAQLNIYNGAYSNSDNIYAGNPNNLIKEAVLWLTGKAPYAYSDGSTGNIDKNGNGILDLSGSAADKDYDTGTKTLLLDANGSRSGTALTSNLQAWQFKVDVDGNSLANDVWANGEGLKNALQAFNEDRLVTSADGAFVGYATNGIVDPGSVFDNTVQDAFWDTLDYVSPAIKGIG